MTQEQKELLLKDLCARLPYGIKAEIKYYDDAWKLLAIYTNGTTYAIRGMDNMIFGIYSYYSDEECEEALQALTNGELEVSSKTHKHTRLEIDRIVKHSNFEKLERIREL